MPADVRTILAEIDGNLTHDPSYPARPSDQRYSPLRQSMSRRGAPKVFLGVHRGRWLEQLPVPMCVSLRTMEKYCDDWDTHPKAFESWMLDSGAYTEITRHGEWRYYPDLFGAVVTRILDNVATPPMFCAPQDWPCEPDSLAASGLIVADHQELTVESVCYLRTEFPHVPWIPVLQGWERDQYVRHLFMYREAGIDLTTEPIVGLGSVCRRGQVDQVVDIITTLSRMGIALHAFGIHRNVLLRCGTELSSMDSMAWSRTAFWHDRRHGGPMPGCSHPGSCVNCSAFALRWYEATTRLGASAAA